MAIVVPNEGESALLSFMLGKTTAEAMTLRLSTTNIIAGESATTASVTEIVANKGYAGVALNAANWTITTGDPSQAVYPEVQFSFTEGVGNVYGYYVTSASGKLLWYENFTDGPYAVTLNGDTIRVTPRMTMKDQQDA